MKKIDLRQEIQPIRTLVTWSKITEDPAIDAPWEWFATRIGALDYTAEGFTPDEAEQLATALAHTAERLLAVSRAITSTTTKKTP